MRFSIPAVLLLALCGQCPVYVIAQEAVPEHPKIHVVIIGVPRWSLDDYKFSALGDSITDACGKIVEFFKARFPSDQIEFHPASDSPCTEENTTYAAIRKLLYTTLPSFGRGTLTFVFMMSHGEIVHYDNRFLENDLRFITSDTSESDRDGTSISLGIEVLNWLTKMPSGSTVLMFVDTCNASSVNTLKISLENSIQAYLGLRFGLVAASLKEESSYNANFIRALLMLWQAHPCPTDSFENWIHTKISEMPGIGNLEALDGYPQIIIPFGVGGSWCFSDLSAEGKLLFLYQGSATNVLWSISRQEQGDDFRNPKTLFVASSPFALQVVPPGHYVVTAEIAGDKQKKVFSPVDLVQNPTAPVFLGSPKTPIETWKVFQGWKEGAEFKGVSEASLEKLDVQVSIARQAATGASTTSGVREATPPLLPPPPPLGGLIGSLAGGGKGAGIGLLIAGGPGFDGTLNSGDLRQQGLQLLREGAFQDAAYVFSRAAESSPGPTSRKNTAWLAYIAATAAGDASFADLLRKRFVLKIAPEYSGLSAAVQSALRLNTRKAKDKLRAVGTTLLLNHQIDLILNESE